MATELIGYSDKFSVTPGERLAFKVSTDLPEYENTIVRLIHGDENPAGPGFKEEVVPTPVNGAYPGRRQQVHCGSWLMVPDRSVLRGLNPLTLQAWIFPTGTGRGERQGLISKWWSSEPAGYGLGLGPDGDLELRVGCRDGDIHSLSTGRALRGHHWYFVAATIDLSARQVRLCQQECFGPGPDRTSCSLTGALPRLAAGDSDAPLLMAAGCAHRLDGRSLGKELYDGKLDRPSLFRRALANEELEQLRQGASPLQVGRQDLVAAWDFSKERHTSRVRDLGPYKLHATAVNMPARAVTGHNWSGREPDFRRSPGEYGAIHFHGDDLEDAAWRTDFTLTVPQNLRSGIYAARLRGADREDHIPFFVRPGEGARRAPAALLVPTLTYLAYANERMDYSRSLAALMATSRPLNRDPRDLYLVDHPELSASLYDHHRDGSGFFYSSRLRPITNLRPKYRKWRQGGPRHLASDLYLVDWLETKGFACDIITDEDLHARGLELLRDYRVLLTGTHPEYTTGAMLSALAQYLGQGGRLMYLGGNGFYWVTSISEEKPHVMEVRRGHAGSRTWESAPGEVHHSTTGEMGGLWRHRGKAPNKLVGVGLSCMGWSTESPGYARTSASGDPRAAFIFEGVGEREAIGAFGLAMGGAAGDELDRLDFELGTPPHALLLASSTGHNHHYQQVIEDIPQLKSERVYGGSTHPPIRADMVYFETARGGAVFSVGSMSWCGSLSHNDYDNNVSRITENVLRTFLR